MFILTSKINFMKSYLLALFLLPALFSSAQLTKSYPIDRFVTVQMPDEFQSTDTLGQSISTGYTDYAMISVSKMEIAAGEGVSVRDQHSLAEFYTGFRKGVVRSFGATLIAEDITEHNGLTWNHFSCRVTNEDGVNIRHCEVLFLQNAIYSMQYWIAESDIADSNLLAEQKQFFSSIKTAPELTHADQYTDEAIDLTRGDNAENLGKLTGFIIIAVIILYFVVQNKRKKKQLP